MRWGSAKAHTVCLPAPLTVSFLVRAACSSSHCALHLSPLVCQPAGRHIFALVSGFLLIYYPFGNGCFHALIPSVLAYAAMRRYRARCGTAAWLIAFPYLIMA